MVAVTATVDTSAPARRVLATGAAIFLAIYALTAAWIVLAATADPPVLELELSHDGEGIIVRGAIDSAANRAELLTAVGELTDVAVILSDIEIDPDAKPSEPIDQTAWRLVHDLPDRPG